MNNIIRKYNQNRIFIWIAVAALIAIYFIIRSINNSIYEKNISNANNSSSGNATTVIESGGSVGKTGQTQTQTQSGAKVEANTEIDAIKNFIAYCNNGEISNAYSLLNEDCKQALYGTEEQFKQKYFNKTFTNKRDYEIELWSGNTYKIIFYDDLISTGKTQKENVIQDYITVRKVEDNYRLSIDNFVKKVAYNTKTTESEIDITIVNRKVYRTYETYEIIVKNNRNEKIQLDDLKQTNTIYLLDNNGIKYELNSFEIAAQDFVLDRKVTKVFNLNFNISYSGTRSIDKLVFSNILVDGKVVKVNIDV